MRGSLKKYLLDTGVAIAVSVRQQHTWDVPALAGQHSWDIPALAGQQSWDVAALAGHHSWVVPALAGPLEDHMSTVGGASYAKHLPVCGFPSLPLITLNTENVIECDVIMASTIEIINLPFIGWAVDLGCTIL